MSTVYLSQMTLYPIKSLAGVNVSQWPVIATGFKYDRKWMLIDAQGRFMSQRNSPRMALIHVELSEHALQISAPMQGTLTLPLTQHSERRVDCTIWQDQCRACLVSDEADRWFSEFLQQPCRLVYQANDDIRHVDQNYAQLSDQTAFSDGFPFLLISESSLALLNAQMGLNLPMARFRPNLVVSGCEAYAEDGWRAIRINNLDFRLPKPCSRCAIPSLNPETGEYGKEPLATLSRTRKWQNKVYFGQNVLHNQQGILSVGDEIIILSEGQMQPPL
ncbi:MOSC domain-containing protein [Methylocucumis oryzae]|uniref:Oxidoreductase n=1 Tax=Methylocucumis oryzae TaxID=1632867 RepID=A0A0F3IP21_9GAMM|nr:MOSC N-terminal beta barrel domain-containing protein [Methylocucumis oryzae]KJV07334.1 oxidoreductase [Methylocucumis oryzae]